MRIETTRDILEHSKKFHQIIAQYYKQLRKIEEKERVKLLLNYLEERENQIEKTISEIENSASANVLNAWFSHSQCEKKLEVLATLVKEEKVTVDELIDLFVYVDNCLIDLYTKLVDNAENTDVQELFKNLSKMEENHKIKTLKNASQIEDI
ncbi:MAG: hypothetical protein IPM32_14070 [Ignavibacteriae bacterium]|nr:hypothetical protein [Ignavibacteriota bacterium]